MEYSINLNKFSLGAYTVGVFAFFVSVFEASAQVQELQTIQDSADAAANIVNTVTVIFVGLAFVYFFYNLGLYVLQDEGKEKAKIRMGWGIAAMVVITSLWFVIAFFRSTLGLQDDATKTVELPRVELADR